MDVGVEIALGETAARASARSRSSLDAPLSHVAELRVTSFAEDAIVLGAFQRASSLAIPSGASIVRRASGGPNVFASRGSLLITLALAHPSALTPCDPRKITNRYVRPLLRAITRFGVRAAYFGKDWISVEHRPAAFTGFAHDARSQRCTFEAIVAVSTSFAMDDRASYAGKSPATLDELASKSIDIAKLADAVAESYVASFDATRVDLSAPSFDVDEEDVRADPPWASSIEEPIGIVAAGRDRNGALKLGGDMFASRDAIALAGSRVDELPRGAGVDTIGRIIDEIFTPSNVALDGVRNLTSLRDVLMNAR
jgi:lipoate-protein ligase A